jgi:cell division protein FtsL
MKNIKEMIISILLGFTLVISIYSTIKISELEGDISDLDSDISDLERKNSDLESQIYELSYLENDLYTLKQELQLKLRLKGIFIN